MPQENKKGFSTTTLNSLFRIHPWLKKMIEKRDQKIAELEEKLLSLEHSNNECPRCNGSKGWYAIGGIEHGTWTECPLCDGRGIFNR